MLSKLRYFFEEVTKGEIIITCILLVIWSTICVFINMAISNSVTKSNEVYYKAIQINEDDSLFEYAMKTNAGNALVYGTVSAVDAVSNDMLKGKYLAIEINIDRYERKVRYEDITDEDGNVIGQKEVEYTEWEHYKTTNSHSNVVNFLGKDFPYDKLNISNYSRLNLNSTTVNDRFKDKISWNYIYPNGKLFTRVGDFRYSFSVVPLEQKVTVLAHLKDNSMFNTNLKSNNVRVHYNSDIDDVMSSISKTKSLPNILFSIIWYIIFIVIAYLFVSSRNRWADC